MKFNFEEIKTTFQNFNIYQKIAGVVLAVSIPLCIGLGVSAVATSTDVDAGSSLSQLISSVVQSSSVAESSSAVSSSRGAVKISLKPSSVEEDLEVQVIDEYGRMIVGPEFELVVKGVKNGYNKTWKVNDGFLRLTKLPSGDYTVEIKEKEGYTIPEEPVKITVAKKVAYKEVDVSDKVVDESKVDVSKEDAAYDDQVSTPATTPAPIKDTVEFVKSSKKTEEKEVEEIIIKYKPVLVDGKTMADASGASTGLYPVLDADGYVIGAYRLEDAPTSSAASAVEIGIMPVHFLTINVFATNSDANQAMPVDEESTPAPETTPEATVEPTPEPTPEATPEPTREPTPEQTPEVTVQPSPEVTPEPTPSSEPSVAPSPEVSPSPEVTPSVEPTPSSSPSSSQGSSSSDASSGSESSSSSSSSSKPEQVKVEVKIFDDEGQPLKNQDGTPMVQLIAEEIKTKVVKDVTTYYGWHNIDGNRYYFDKKGNKVTGTQVIQGITYYFDKNGKMGSRIGIDISKYQPTIDWKTVKEAGVEFVIIRAGYRGYGSGALVEDPYFKKHIQGATSVGLKVGVYVFSQAITTQEAVEEASLCLQLVKGYKIDYPIFFDTEYSTSAKTGRADGLSKSQRTTIAKAFCETIQNAGYNAGIYASKTWFYYQLEYSQISKYDIWVAHYAAATDFQYHYDIWQYTGTGTCAGVAGAVDMNIGYTAY